MLGRPTITLLATHYLLGNFFFNSHILRTKYSLFFVVEIHLFFFLIFLLISRRCTQLKYFKLSLVCKFSSSFPKIACICTFAVECYPFFNMFRPFYFVFQNGFDADLLFVSVQFLCYSVFVSMPFTPTIACFKFYLILFFI